jgi:hypothetical protein
VVSPDNKMNSEFSEANELWAKGQSQLREGKKQEAQTTMRASLQRLRDAFHITSEDKAISRLLHQRGRTVHDLFGCSIRMAGQTYYVECPVMLSHTKLGFSVGGFANAICSICGKDPWDCEHIRGFKYNHIRAQKIGGVCNICLKENCNHQIGEIYDNVQAVHIITKLELDHVSLVENPANPLARIHMYTLSPEEVRETLPDSEKALFVPGKTVIHCHHCVECSTA